MKLEDGGKQQLILDLHQIMAEQGRTRSVAQ
jgi:hypothetical protein